MQRPEQLLTRRGLAFFLANEYLRAQGLRGLAGSSAMDAEIYRVADQHIKAASGRSDVDGLAQVMDV